MIITATAEVLGQTAKVTFEITGEGEVRDEAAGRMYMVARREAQRMAEIAGVDVRDQGIERAEAERLAKLPKDRPSITVAAGTKDPEGVTVHRGTFEVLGRKMSAPAPKGDDRG